LERGLVSFLSLYRLIGVLVAKLADPIIRDAAFNDPLRRQCATSAALGADRSFVVCGHVLPQGRIE
jgi:hypothetical protein